MHTIHHYSTNLDEKVSNNQARQYLFFIQKVCADIHFINQVLNFIQTRIQFMNTVTCGQRGSY